MITLQVLSRQDARRKNPDHFKHETTEFLQEVASLELKYSSKYLGEKENADVFEFVIEGQTFEYRCGFGFRLPVRKAGTVHVVLPHVADVLLAVYRDGQAGSMSFAEFCSDLGYDEDSRKALAIYLACQENGVKLRKISKWKQLSEILTKWETEV